MTPSLPPSLPPSLQIKIRDYPLFQETAKPDYIVLWSVLLLKASTWSSTRPLAFWLMTCLKETIKPAFHRFQQERSKFPGASSYFKGNAQMRTGPQSQQSPQQGQAQNPQCQRNPHCKENTLEIPGVGARPQGGESAPDMARRQGRIIESDRIERSAQSQEGKTKRSTCDMSNCVSD